MSQYVLAGVIVVIVVAVVIAVVIAVVVVPVVVMSVALALSILDGLSLISSLVYLDNEWPCCIPEWKWRRGIGVTLDEIISDGIHAAAVVAVIIDDDDDDGIIFDGIIGINTKDDFDK